ncbi:MAG TPA: hypothetical protein VHZ55_16955 [Bryobacteraceae bacterium]|nr:hypothetical protein [Bryobacteraceae bacterium]
MASGRFEWARSLLTGGISYLGAAALTALSQTPHYPHAAALGAFAVGAAGVGGAVFNHTVSKLLEAQNNEQAERNHLVRHGMAEALERSLRAVQTRFETVLPHELYDKLFESWFAQLDQALTPESGMLESLFPLDISEAYWEALTRYEAHWDENLLSSLPEQAGRLYRANEEQDVEAIAGLLRHLAVDSDRDSCSLLRDRLLGGWDAREAKRFAHRVMPVYRMAFASIFSRGGPHSLAIGYKGMTLTLEKLAEIEARFEELRARVARGFEDLKANEIAQADRVIGAFRAELEDKFSSHPEEYRSLYKNELKQHWKPRAMGCEGIFYTGRWYFAGRTAALRKILSWMAQRSSGGGAMAITGDPGSGKSAVLGYVVAASDPEEVKEPGLRDFLASMPEDIWPEVGGVTFAIDLRGKNLVQVQAALASCFMCEPDELMGTLAKRREKTVLVFDGLEEAERSAQITDLLLRPLTRYEQIWVLVGSRRPELVELGERVDVLDLDTATFLNDSDLEWYVKQLLLAEGEPGISPYRDNEPAALKAAHSVSRVVKGNFLLAHIIARTLIERQTFFDPESEQIPRTPEKAFRKYLEDAGKRGGVDYHRLRRALRPLAYAQGNGLPREVWKRLTTEDLDLVLELVTAFIKEYQEDAYTVYRLYHNALAEAVREVQNDAQQHLHIAENLIAGLPGNDWLRADWYTRKYLATHAAKSGMLDDLLLDTKFLAVANRDRLLAVLDCASSAEARRRANWYRLTEERLIDPDAGTRLNYLELVALENAAQDLAQSAHVPNILSPWHARWAHCIAITPHRVLRGHIGQVNTVAIKNNVIVSGSWDKTVRIWDSETGQQFGEPLSGHEAPITAVAIDGHIVASGGRDGIVRLWNWNTVQPIGKPLLAHNAPVNTVAISGEVMATGSEDRTVRLWNWKSGQPIGDPFQADDADVSALEVLKEEWTPTVPVEVWMASREKALTLLGRRILCVAVDENMVLAADQNGTLRTWDWKTRRPIGEFASDLHGGIDVAVDGRFVACSSGHSVSFWDWKTGQRAGHLERPRFVSRITLWRDVVVFVNSDDSVELWNWRTGEAMDLSLLGPIGVLSVAIGSHLVVFGCKDNAVRVCDLNSALPIGESYNEYAGVIALATTEHRVVSGSDSGTVRIWDRRTGRPIGQGMQTSSTGEAVVAIAIARDMIVSGGSRGAVQLWNWNNGEEIGEPLRKHSCRVSAVSISNDVAVTAEFEGNTCVWDVRTRELIDHRRLMSYAVLAAAVSGDEILTLGKDGAVGYRNWRKRGIPSLSKLPTGVLLLDAAAFCGDLAVVIAGGYWSVWNWRTCRLIKKLPVPFECFSAVAMSGNLVASADRDGAVLVWDLETVPPLYRTIYLAPRVWAIALEERTLYAACSRGLICVELAP